MPSSSSVIEARRAFGRRLRLLRENGGLTTRELARRCGWHESKCSRIEHGHSQASVETVKMWARACGAGEQIEELLEAARGIEGMYVEWREMEGSGLRHAQDSVRLLWERTRAFRAYSQNMIPGLLQTPAYTRAVLNGIRNRRGLRDDVEEALAVRIDRQGVLDDKTRSFEIVLEEAALYRRVGPPELMAEQLWRLLEIAARPHVRLGIIPRDADRHLMLPVEDFWIFDGRQVDVELVSGFLRARQHHELKLYTEDFNRLDGLAVHGGPVLQLIATVLTAYDS
ncbi:helix-turn-helix transcriptional regulator [Streptomyces sp. NPDC020875]|uniref:helix-turn-helix domain-containing protein n=1 Tax=Streptomyces sp. NPDC020875 TaxID=3154898 RepID=UPI0034062BDA